MSNRQRRPKALLVGIDGFNLDRLSSVDAPTLRRLADGGGRRPGDEPGSIRSESRIYPDGETMTVSGPGWSTILTGTWPGKHGVVDNTIEPNDLASYPDLITRTHRAASGGTIGPADGPADADLTTFYLACWQPLYDQILTREVDHRFTVGKLKGKWAEADRMIRDAAVELVAGDVDLGFVYFGSLDEHGHAFGSQSPEYDAAITAIDGHLAELFATIAARPSYADEDWLIAITTDHGHRPEGGHGGQTDPERSTFTLWSGPAVDPEKAAASRMVDLAPTLLDHVGVTPRAAWDLDGNSVLRDGRESR